MNNSFHLAAAEKGLGFFSLNIGNREISWAEETVVMFGARAGEEKTGLIRRLGSNLRNYILSDRADEFRCIVPLNGRTVEIVILEGLNGSERRGFFAPYHLYIPLEMMKKYFLSNISNKLRSLLNSVIIAADVAAMSEIGEQADTEKLLSLMANDAREVNDLLNRMGETISYTPPEGSGVLEKIDLRSLLMSIHANLHYLAEDASINLFLALPEFMPALKGEFSTYLLAFFLAIRYALSNTEPMGEIIISAREDSGPWSLEICFSNDEIPVDMAISPDRHGLSPAPINGWAEGAELQLIDSLIGLYDGELTLMENSRGDGLLRLFLGHS